MAYGAAQKAQDIPADVEAMVVAHKTMLDARVGDLERRIESVITQEDSFAAKARLLRRRSQSGAQAGRTAP